jgi:hypothetical protein
MGTMPGTRLRRNRYARNGERRTIGVITDRHIPIAHCFGADHVWDGACDAMAEATSLRTHTGDDGSRGGSQCVRRDRGITRRERPNVSTVRDLSLYASRSIYSREYDNQELLPCPTEKPLMSTKNMIIAAIALPAARRAILHPRATRRRKARKIFGLWTLARNRGLENGKQAPPRSPPQVGDALAAILHANRTLAQARRT